MTELLDIPRLARDVLRRYGIERVLAKLPVAWVSEDGFQRSAGSHDAKQIGYWKIQSNGCEYHLTAGQVIEELMIARAIEVIE